MIGKVANRDGVVHCAGYLSDRRFAKSQRVCKSPLEAYGNLPLPPTKPCGYKCIWQKSPHVHIKSRSFRRRLNIRCRIRSGRRPQKRRSPLNGPRPDDPNPENALIYANTSDIPF